ncbi:alpha/beta-hydrolase [Punctularia strigosozonata HHB-11173 SS5]|uniref:alpha/beta-hydrolase n=1 Tax=Punctularia strigosozonata (strain HHB-11173) TaxID=741275 RepID=UPI0004416E87|nr:alpha/beta-hydrolase [Punctularia strigosozonata HHB-11173 SS5]EIN14616.1 alpha/beta-hydrolase [Punctularia strigosozonata HHB-11173 SS5]
MSSVPITVTYSRADGLDIKLDVYVPEGVSGSAPAVLFFHGGGLASGDRRDLWFPSWLKDASLERGWCFLSADHRLLVPFTAHDILADVRALAAYISSGQWSLHLPSGASPDPSRLFVSGGSAGGYLARLYALHASPKPKAVLSLFGMGGAFLTDHWVLPHPDGIPFWGGRLPFSTVNAALGLPEGVPVPPSAGSPVRLGPKGPYCEDGRGALATRIIQEGLYLDYFTGKQGLAAELKKYSTARERAAALPEEEREVFPELRVKELPPTFLIHGDKDTLVLLHESEVTLGELRESGVKSELVVVEGAEHGLQLASDLKLEAPGVPEAYAKAMEFLEGCL